MSRLDIIIRTPYGVECELSLSVGLYTLPGGVGLDGSTRMVFGRELMVDGIVYESVLERRLTSRCRLLVDWFIAK
jgi:hypothetical protein